MAAPARRNARRRLAGTRARVLLVARWAGVVCARRRRCEGAVGPSTLRITIRPRGGAAQDLSRSVEIHAAHYRTGTLTRRAAVCCARGRRAASGSKPRSSSRQRCLRRARRSRSGPEIFARRLRRAHRQLRHAAHLQRPAGQRSQGHGFSRAMGTPVRAGNSGVVVLARPLYYEGNCVVIDHGLGLYTISMHLSRIDVHEGQRVTTGRAAGPERRNRPRNRPASALGRALAECVSRSREVVAAGSERRALARNSFFFDFARCTAPRLRPPPSLPAAL